MDIMDSVWISVKQIGYLWIILMGDEKRNTLGERLRQERRLLGMSQEELAKSIGIHRRTQTNYELGSTMPDAAYFQAIRRIGIDAAYVQTGNKSTPSQEQSNATERLFMALCDALQIPLDKVHAALNGAAAVGASHSEFQGQIRNLMHASPLLNARNKVLVLDRDILVDIVEGLERCLVAMDKRVSPLQKAHAIATLYRDFSETGEIDMKMLESCVRSIPEA
jgi:transcriptional regulator with XRE-family HTH domain